MMNGKVCSKCGIEKSLSEYSKSKTAKDGYQYSCIACNKQYYQTNKEKIKERNKQYQDVNKEKINERRKRYRKINDKKIKEKLKQHRDDSREKINKQAKQYRQENKEEIAERDKRYYQNNEKKFRERNKQYRVNNVEKLREYRQSERGREAMYRGQMKRRSNKHFVQFTHHQREEILNRNDWCCQECGKKVHDRHTGNWNTPDKAHIDHIIPLSKGGNSEPNNLQTLCRTCNLSKNSKSDIELDITGQVTFVI